ncbi:transportin MOS14-like [Bidens hawaiensis]|uniref:transportin MOS14-like n=1 Tax=Bidens hawaiensis TaxID=980011 RepID=UPI00404B7B09
MAHEKIVKDALNALYHHPDDAIRSQADHWLQNFQRTLVAWQVSDNLLHDSSSNVETLIFCSQTLRSKVQRAFEELPSEAFRPLRDSLNNLLKKFHKGPPKVRTQISLAVAALAVQVPAEDWGNGGIMNWLRAEMSAHPDIVPSFLELLRVLPEEVFNYKIAARPDRRRKFEDELVSTMDVALGILTACLNIPELKEQALEAFSSWLRLRHRISASVLATHPLVLTALSSLTSDVLSEAAVNVISELIHYTSSRNLDGFSVQMPLIQVIVPQVMNLKPQLRDSSKDEEDVKAIARLFADMGDSYVELIATGSNESILIVHALLEVAAHTEYDIASMAFNFWHNLQICLIERESYLSLGNESLIEDERNRRVQIFRSSYETLVSLVSCRVQYPQDYSELSKEDQKDFKQTRYVFYMPRFTKKKLKNVFDICREASNSILSFLSDIFDLGKSSQGHQFISIRDDVIVPRGATITRVLIAAATGALPSSRLETVAYALLALSRAYGVKALEWAKQSVSLLPASAVTETEKSRFLLALSDAASGVDIKGLTSPIEELSEVCRRNRTVQEIVLEVLRPLELNMVFVS